MSYWNNFLGIQKFALTRVNKPLMSESFNPYPAVHDNPTFANSVDPDQMASEEAIWSGSTLFVIQFVNLNENII